MIGCEYPQGMSCRKELLFGQQCGQEGNCHSFPTENVGTDDRFLMYTSKDPGQITGICEVTRMKVLCSHYSVFPLYYRLKVRLRLK